MSLSEAFSRGWPSLELENSKCSIFIAHRLSSTHTHTSTRVRAFCGGVLLNPSRGYDSESLMGEWDSWFFLELGLRNTKSPAMNFEMWSRRGEREGGSFTLTQPGIRGLYESVMLHIYAHTHTHTHHALPLLLHHSLSFCLLCYILSLSNPAWCRVVMKCFWENISSYQRSKTPRSGSAWLVWTSLRPLMCDRRVCIVCLGEKCAKQCVLSFSFW